MRTPTQVPVGAQREGGMTPELSVRKGATKTLLLPTLSGNIAFH